VAKIERRNGRSKAIRPPKIHGIRIADKPFVARKFHTAGTMLRSAPDSAAMNLRMATMQITGMRVPPRVRTIPHVRRRIPITMVNEPAEVVVVRQAVHNLGNTIHKARLIQDQRA
jgi:hypothetical protein